LPTIKPVNHYQVNQGNTLNETQYFDPDDSDVLEHSLNSEENSQDQRDLNLERPQTPQNLNPPPIPTTPKKVVRVQSPPPVRQSTRIKKPVVRTGRVYGDKPVTEILREEISADADVLKELTEIARESGNDSVNFLLSKAILEENKIPVTYKDVDKMKKLDDKAYQEWLNAMKDEVNALNDQDVWELVDCPNN